MPYECIKCGEDVNVKRWNLNYRTCLACGDKAAHQQIIMRQTQVMPMHKGNLMLITGSTEAERRANVLNMTGKGKVKHNV